MAKTHDLAVKVGEYEKGGEKKNEYQNVGVILEGQYGPYILLNRTFNPAALGEGKSVLISMFPAEQKEKDPFNF